eukprot:4171708-Prorocentrum_lima.AAC.1
MIGEVRVRALEEDVESRMRPTLTNRFTVTSLAANQMSAIPTAAGVEGVTKKVCQRFASDQGCPLGRKCQYEHPRDCPGKCFICSSINHMSRD